MCIAGTYVIVVDVLRHHCSWTLAAKILRIVKKNRKWHLCKRRIFPVFEALSVEKHVYTASVSLVRLGMLHLSRPLRSQHIRQKIPSSQGRWCEPGLISVPGAIASSGQRFIEDTSVLEPGILRLADDLSCLSGSVEKPPGWALNRITVHWKILPLYLALTERPSCLNI